MSTITAERPEQAANAKSTSQPTEQRLTPDPKIARPSPEPVFTDWASI